MSWGTLGPRGFYSRAADGNPSLRFGGRRPTARAAKRREKPLARSGFIHRSR